MSNYEMMFGISSISSIFTFISLILQGMKKKLLSKIWSKNKVNSQKHKDLKNGFVVIRRAILTKKLEM